MLEDKKYLFLDRDGVINTTAHGFANQVEDFIFAKGALEALRKLSSQFERIFVVTNQGGIGYGYMKISDLEHIHSHMCTEIKNHGGRIDAVYYCPDRVANGSPCRKPNPGMALQAQADFPEVVFHQSIMVGDQASDIEFGHRLDMTTVRITQDIQEIKNDIKADFYFDSLLGFAEFYQV